MESIRGYNSYNPGPKFYLYPPYTPMSVESEVIEDYVFEQQELPSVSEFGENMSFFIFPTEQLVIDSIRVDHLVVDFSSSLKAKHVYEPDTKIHRLEIPELDIFNVGSTIEECYAGVQKDLAVIWKEIAMANDKELTSDALEVKKYLLSLKQ